MEPEQPGAQPLQFDVAEIAHAAQTRACAACNGPINDVYYEINGKLICPACRPRLEAAIARGFGGPGVFVRAALFGLGAALLGCVAWYGIRVVTKMEFGLVAIFVGIGVGIAVKKGAGGFGGWQYQALAMFLTYNAACMNYAPDVLRGLVDRARAPAAASQAATGDATKPTTATAPAAPAQPPSLGGLIRALVMLYGLMLALPFFGLPQNILGIIIIGIGVYEA
jgi:hypothetical protein